VPRVLAGTAGIHVALPSGTWRHALVDGLPDESRSLAVDDPLEAFPAIVLVRG
jgi:hypothetical protein